MSHEKEMLKAPKVLSQFNKYVDITKLKKAL